MIHAATTPEERRRKILEKINSLKTDIDQGQHRRQQLQLKQWAAHELKTEEPDVVWRHGEDALPRPAPPRAQVCTVHCPPRANGVSVAAIPSQRLQNATSKGERGVESPVMPLQCCCCRSGNTICSSNSGFTR